MIKVVAFSMSVVTYLYLAFSGFSITRMGWLSDDEMIEIAANFSASYDIGTIQYKSGSELLSQNPGCCQVDRDEKVLLRVIGWYIATVSMTYMINKDGEERYYHNTIAVNSSGRVKDVKGIADFTSMN